MSQNKGLLQDEDLFNKSPTVDELMRMLSDSNSSKLSTTSPPPVPPKPKHGLGMTIEAAMRSLGIASGPNSKHDANHKSAKDSQDAAGEVMADNIVPAKRTTTATMRTMMNSTELELDAQQHVEGAPMNTSRDSADFGLSDDLPHAKARRATPGMKAPLGGCVVYNSNNPPAMVVAAAADRTSGDIFQQPTTTSSAANRKTRPTNKLDASSDIFQKPSMTTINVSRKTRPIVTDAPTTEANNNNLIAGSRESSTSTVEILEIPANQGRDNHGNRSNRTFTRAQHQQQQQQQQPEQYILNQRVICPPDPLLTLNHDSDDGTTHNLETAHRARQTNNRLDVESATTNDDSIDDEPLRSSTPTSTQYQIDNNSSSGASTATNNNRSSQNTYLSHGTRESASDNSEGDTLNISRDTDDTTNTSAHNQSGCELVGIEDPPGSKDSSPKKACIGESNLTTPYTVQLFNETLMSTASPNHFETSNGNKVAMSIQELKSENLGTLVTTLQDEIKSLNSKVTRLSTKVEDLEYQLERQRQTATFNKSTSSIYNHQRDDSSPSATLQKGAYSRSVSTINKLTPIKPSQHSANHSQMSAYSRTSMAALNVPSTSANNNSPSQTLQRNGRRMQVQQQHIIASGGGNMNSSSLKRLPVHASTNSIYAESNKSGSTSISPTPLAPNNRHQATSPSSYLSLAQKRDQNSFASMLSLSSIGNSTLKNTSIAGSASNLSQFGTISKLSNWPSLSNFVQSTHQAKDILYDDDEQVIRMILYNTLITMRVPTWFEGEYNLDQIVEAPNVRLKLNWVHGYRGRDCRSNVYYLPTGECVYFVASIIVIYNPEARSQRHYLGHTESIKCLAIHPNRLIVASGQSAVPNRKDKRPIVRVWNTVSLATLRVIEFNEDFDRSICCLAFSKHDMGATLAVVDESSEHTITLLDWQREKNWRLAEVNSGHEPVLAIDFHPIDKYSLVAVGKATVNFWDIRGFAIAKKAGLFDKYDKPKYVLCMTFNDVGETITGDSNGNVIIWPRGANKPRRIIRNIHAGGVFSILAMRDGTYLTGGRDGRIIEWNEAFEQTGRLVELPEHCGGVRFITTARGSQVLIGTLRNSILVGSIEDKFNVIMQGHTEAATALATHPNQAKYLTGGFDDQIFFINARTHTVEWTKCLAMPVTAACFSPNGRLLIIGSTSGNWIALDGITQEILFTACDGAGTINCVKFSPDGEFFSMGSSDCHVYVYQTNGTGNTFLRVGTCVGHSAPIKEIDWSDDNTHFQSQSMNFELLFWRAQNCRPVDDDNIVHDLKWSTHNCTIGFNVIGIWSDSIDSALVTHCDISNNGKYVAAATDTGYISIYKRPTYHNQCQSHKYNGNVDKFNFIEFLHDDSKLIAVGAKSCVTTEWTIEHQRD